MVDVQVASLLLPLPLLPPFPAQPAEQQPASKYAEYLDFAREAACTFDRHVVAVRHELEAIQSGMTIAESTRSPRSLGAAYAHSMGNAIELLHELLLALESSG